MRTIIVEDKLSAMFGLIPARTFTKPDNTVVNVLKPTYDFGGFEEYNALIKEKGDAIYPLIFQKLNVENQSFNNVDVTTDIELIVAKNNKRTGLRNPTRWKTSYQNILMPLVNDIIKCFNESGIIMWDGTYTLEKHPNYAANNETKDTNQVIDIIDVVVLKAIITIKGKGCINKTIFNT